jgi:hypothetical protein
MVFPKQYRLRLVVWCLQARDGTPGCVCVWGGGDALCLKKVPFLVNGS